jgi:HSP20 family molecular chaperone IbpA
MFPASPVAFNYTFAPAGAGAWQGIVNPAFWGAVNPAAGWQAAVNPLNWAITPQNVAFAPTPGLAQPRVDLFETNSDVVVAAELPNINPNNLNLTVTDDSITISASTIGMPGMGVTSIYRTISLPTNVRAEHCSASYNNGILEVRLPKADLAARRRIQVTSR